MNKHDKLVRNSVISIFVALYFCVSIISTIHVIDFFALTNPHWLAVSLAIAFEIGAAASLAAIIILEKTSRGLVWFLFILLTLVQCMGNMYYSYDHVHNYQSWMELFALNEEEVIYQKRILAIISGAILPIVALGFIKSLVDYVRPNEKQVTETPIVTIPTETQKEYMNEYTTDSNNIEKELQPKEEMSEEYLGEELDEEALLAEEVPVVIDSIDEIESVKDNSISNILSEVQDQTIIQEEASNKDVELIMDKPLEDAKLEVIKEVRRQEEKGEGDTFGPPFINNQF